MKEEIKITEESIWELYKKMDLKPDKQMDIETLGREYMETLAFLQKECINTMVYENR